MAASRTNPDEEPIAAGKPVPLDYAPRVPWHRRRRFRRLAIGLILAATVGCLFLWRDALWLRAQVLYWQRQCAQSVLPADRIVYETDPQKAAELLGQRQYVNDAASRGMPDVVASWHPAVWRELHDLLIPPQPGLRFMSEKTPVVFLHERTSRRTGLRRIVVISYWGKNFLLPTEGREDWGELMCATVLEPVGLVGSMPIPAQSRLHCSLEAAVPFAAKPQTPQQPTTRSMVQRIYAGQADPNDSSRFTIECETESGRMQIEGWLEADGTSVAFTAPGPRSSSAGKENPSSAPATSPE